MRLLLHPWLLTSEMLIGAELAVQEAPPAPGAETAGPAEAAPPDDVWWVLFGGWAKGFCVPGRTTLLLELVDEDARDICSQ